ncbi:hypothetical protein JRQ81_015330 [Phrynocephalus forsythii]|uniref:Uncharacterized protein n=1 Tax=Phrynocephalus forsythii TaxID=171643 RepID=A0A9Q0XUD1_9SAUR|nr:hypothetical protein JRQ81_015330 [Phrynocephalus forsythii]
MQTTEPHPNKTLPTITTESAIHNNNLPVAEAELLRLKVSATLSSAQRLPCDLTSQERSALTSLRKDENLTILPVGKGSCTVILNTVDYYKKVISLLDDQHTYEKLKRDPINFKKKK